MSEGVNENGRPDSHLEQAETGLDTRKRGLSEKLDRFMTMCVGGPGPVDRGSRRLAGESRTWDVVKGGGGGAVTR